MIILIVRKKKDYIIKLLNTIILLFTLVLYAKSQNPDSIIVLTNETKNLNIGKQVYFLEDPEGILTIEDVQNSEYQNKFKKSIQETLNFGFTDSYIWIKITLKQESNNKFYLLLKESKIKYADLFFQLNDDKWVQISNGYIIPYERKMTKHNHQLYTILFKKPNINTPQIFYIRLRPDAMPVPLEIIEKEYFDTYINFWEKIVLTGFHVLLCLIIANNIYIFIQQLNYLNLLYSFLVMCCLGYSIQFHGYLVYISPLLYKNTYLCSHILTALPQSFYIIFSFRLLNIKKISPLLYTIGSLVIFCYFIESLIAIPSIIIYDQISIHFGIIQFLALLSLFVSFLSGLIVGIKGNIIGIYHFLAYFLYCIFVICEILHFNYEMPYLFHLPYIDLAFLSESIILALALNQKNATEKKLLQQEKEQVQISLMKNLKENEKLIKEQNTVLEKKVQERTEELQLLNEELNSTVEELGLTLENLEFQRKTIESINRKMTASINYAQTIQQAVLTDKLILESYLQDYFLLYRPKDIVSGDFYWVAPIPKGYVVAIADCTGHGVAGSFMSLVGINLLGKMEDELETLSPAEMIRRLNIGVDKALKQDERQSYNEGMDIGIVRVEKEENNYTLTFAGAKRPLYYIRRDEGKIREIRGDRYSVGIGTQREMNVQNHTLTLKTGDSFYLFSDGLADQNNEKRKRLRENTLKEILQSLFEKDSNTQLIYLNQLLDEHQGTAEQRDDITLLGVKII